jgi:phosphonate transport system permease protein
VNRAPIDAKPAQNMPQIVVSDLMEGIGIALDIRATGARRLPEIIFGVLPQVVPLWSSFALYRLETNVRSATTLGIVGAGGIGQTLYESIRSFHYAETAAQMIVVVITVVLIDMFSARLRKALV